MSFLGGFLYAVGYVLHYDASLEEALAIHRWSVRIAEQEYGSGALEAAESLAGVGAVTIDLGDFASGEKLLRESIAIFERHLGETHPDVAQRLFSLGNFLEENGQYEEAIESWTRAAEIYRQPAYEDGEEVARAFSNIGRVRHRQGRLEESAEFLREAARIRMGPMAADERSRRRVASTHAELAALAHNRGDIERARELYQRALETYRIWAGEDPYRYAETIGRVALLHEESGDWRSALADYETSLGVRLDKLGPDDRRVARSRVRLGRFLARTGNLARAKDELDEARRIQEAGLGDDHIDLGITLIATAHLERLRGNVREARQLAERGIEILERESPEHFELLNAYRELSMSLRLEGDHDEAFKAVETGLRLTRSALGGSNHRVGSLLIERAMFASCRRALRRRVARRPGGGVDRARLRRGDDQRSAGTPSAAFRRGPERGSSPRVLRFSRSCRMTRNVWSSSGREACARALWSSNP